MTFSSRHAAWEDRELDLHLGGDEPEPEYYEDKKGFWHHESGRFASDAEIAIWKRYGRNELHFLKGK